MLVISPGIAQLDVHSRMTFVRSSVKVIPLTDKIIDAIMPYYPKDCLVIAGFLDSSDQFWKVNFHWDLLLSKIDDFLALKTVSDALKTAARAVRQRLMSNPPNPMRGYRTDKTVGATKDQSSHELVIKRHQILKQSKKDFESLIVKAGVVTAATKLAPPLAEKPWWLAVSPVAVPGTSKHGTGYALDIAGNNTETTRISKGLGATLVFNEASHVHVEFGKFA
jgi:hypothetical protein